MNTVFSNISQTTSPTSDSFFLIMSHIQKVTEQKFKFKLFNKYDLHVLVLFNTLRPFLLFSLLLFGWVERIDRHRQKKHQIDSIALTTEKLYKFSHFKVYLSKSALLSSYAIFNNRHRPMGVPRTVTFSKIV